MSKINKALDYNKLLQKQDKGKMLDKRLRKSIYIGRKYDGNYVTIKVEFGKVTFTTSGGHNYTHTDDGGNIFNYVRDGVYLAERIYMFGKLGDRVKCNLKGPRNKQHSTGHTYKVFDYLELDEYDAGYSLATFEQRFKVVCQQFDSKYIATTKLIDSSNLEVELTTLVEMGYEGLVGMDKDWKWSNTTSRTIDFFKYKKRPTVDLLCYGTEEGEGKYEGMIGSLLLMDSEGRKVSVGSGMSDKDRRKDPSYFIGKIVEVFYEQILDTYIQPTFGDEYEGVLIRKDKNAGNID